MLRFRRSPSTHRLGVVCLVVAWLGVCSASSVLALHGRELSTSVVYTSTDLIRALQDYAVSEIVLQAGTYKFTETMLCRETASSFNSSNPSDGAAL